MRGQGKQAPGPGETHWKACKGAPKFAGVCPSALGVAEHPQKSHFPVGRTNGPFLCKRILRASHPARRPAAPLTQFTALALYLCQIKI